MARLRGRRQLRRLFDRQRAGYSRGMSLSRSHPTLRPIKRPTQLDSYAGQWVALKDGQVLFAAKRAVEVAAWLREKGVSDATAQFVARDRGLKVGLG